MSPKTLYKILEIDTEASPDVIEAAYRRLARRYHPDVNASVDATQRMQELNHAYGILRDPSSRAKYDWDLKVEQEAAERLRRSQEQQTSTSATSQSPGERLVDPLAQAAVAWAATAAWAAASGAPVTCEGCGRSDSTLRIAGFPYVYSFIIITRWREERGVYCESCRREQMQKAKTRSALFGWWGFPWGLFYTIGALLAPGDGKMDGNLNADYLKWLGVYFVNTGRAGDALRAFQASLGFRSDPELAQAVRNAFGKSAVAGSHQRANPDAGIYTVQTAPVTKKRGRTVFGALVIVLFIVLAAYYIMSQEFSQGNGQVTTPVGPAAVSPPVTKQVNTLPAVDTSAVVSETSTGTGASKWQEVNVVQGALSLRVPAVWEVTQDENTFAVFVNTDPGSAKARQQWVISRVEMADGYTTSAMIRDIQSSATARDEYQKWIRNFLSDIAENQDGEVVEVGEPKLARMGNVTAIRVDALLSVPVDGERDSQMASLLAFACGSHTCVFDYYRAEAVSSQVDDWSTLSKVVNSVVVN